MSLEKSEIFLKIKFELEKFYRETSETFAKYHEMAFFRNEDYFTEQMPKYIVEVIKPESTNEDDYGIDVDFAISETNNHLIIEIDVLKATGPLYLQKSFQVTKINHEKELTEFLKWLKNLPELVLSIYKKDYT